MVVFDIMMNATNATNEKIDMKLGVEFITLAERDGVRFTDKKWSEGTMVLTGNRLGFIADSDKIEIPLKAIKWVGRPVTG
jgi:hypothetical protein